MLIGTPGSVAKESAKLTGLGKLPAASYCPLLQAGAAQTRTFTRMNRVPPAINTVTSLRLPAYEKHVLSNGIELYTLQGSSEPVMRMEMVFRAGASVEKKNGVAEFMAGLLSEGTQHRSSAAFAEKIESLGATLQTRGGVDTVRVKLFTLTRYFPELISLVGEMVFQPAFDKQELKVYTSNKLERLQIDLKKNEVLAYRHLTESIYGPNHPYGRNNQPQDYRAIRVPDLIAHHHEHLLPRNCMIFISGNFGENVLREIDQYFGTWVSANSNGAHLQKPYIAESRAGRLDVDGPQPHQAAIRIGRKLFTQKHPDFNGLFFLNTILGGYFGSRLMAEIRENLGLTYGIYSGIDSFAEDGCMYISTETTTENIDKLIEAIQLEVSKLKQDQVAQQELNMARNYLMGHLMSQLDGPFASMDFIKSMKIEQLPDDTFFELVETVQSMTPERLQNLAIQYLDLDAWSTIVVR